MRRRWWYIAVHELDEYGNVQVPQTKDATVKVRKGDTLDMLFETICNGITNEELEVTMYDDGEDT